MVATETEIAKFLEIGKANISHWKNTRQCVPPKYIYQINKLIQLKKKEEERHLFETSNVIMELLKHRNLAKISHYANIHVILLQDALSQKKILTPYQLKKLKKLLHDLEAKKNK